MEKSSGVGSFTRRVVLLKDSDCVKHDGKIFMPTTIDMAKIKKPHTGQYNKEVLFSKSMSEEVVRQTLQKAFPLFNLTGRFYCASFGQGSTAFIFHGNPRVWDGKMLRKTVRGNSVLYILLEDDQIPQGSPFKTNDVTISSVPVALSNMNQPILSDTSATVIVQNTLKPPNDNPIQEGNILNEPLASSTNCNLINLQCIADAVAQSNLNQPTLSDSSTTIMVQNTLQPWNAFPSQECNFVPGPFTAKVDMIKSEVASQNIIQPSSSDSSAIVMVQNNMLLWNDISRQDDNTLLETLVSTPDFSTMEPQNATPEDGGLDLETLVAMDQWWEKAGFGDSQMADDNDPIGTLEITDYRPPYQGSLLNSTEMSDSSADNHNTTSGISGLDHNLSLDDLSPHEDENFDFTVEPEKVPLQGGGLCRFSSSRALPRNVQSAFAIFKNLHTVEVKRCGEDSLVGRKIPPSKTPGWVTIFLQRADGKELGETKIWYYDEDKEAVERIIDKPKLQEYFFRKYHEMLSNRNTTTAIGADAQNSGIFGSTEPEQMLCVLVYAAAEIGGQQFIAMIFNSSAGKVVYDCYKDSSVFPEAIAREYGHEKTATFLEEITGRFSKEAIEAQNYPQTVNWSELVRAAEKAQKQPGLSTEEESNHLESNVVKDTGYLGDIDTSSNESCESGSSDSEDNIPFTFKEINYLADKLSEIALYEDQEFGIKKEAVSQSLMYFCETGNFNREQVNSAVCKKVVLPTLEGWHLSLFQDSFIREASGLKHLRSLNRCDTSFFLGPEQESIQCHIIAEYEKWCLLFKYMKDSSLHRRVSRTFAAEGGQFVEQANQVSQAVMMGTSSGCAEDLLRIQSTREVVTTSDNPELAVQWNSAQRSTKDSTSSDLWVLTCLCRPARNIWFLYVADNSDVLPQKAYFEDDRYELSTQYWQWQRYCSSFFDVQNRLREMRKLSEQMRPEFGPTPLPTYGAKMLPQVQGKHVLRQPECCPTWLYIMMHQCWVYAPVDRPPFIAIFDGISSRTLGARLIATWLIQYSQGKSSPLTKCQSEDPRLVNDKTNPPSLNVNVTDYRSERKEKLYEEHLHGDDESNVVCIDKHLLLQESINKEEELPLITAHPPSKIFLGVSKGIGDAQNEVNVETSSISQPVCKRKSRKRRTGLHDGEARSLSVIRCLRKRLSEGLADSTSPTGFTLTINIKDEYLDREWGRGLGEGLATSASLTALTLSINSKDEYLDRDWGRYLGKSLAKSSSLTAFNLTINSKHRFLGGDWGKGLGEGLAKSTSLTAFTLTINGEYGSLARDWGKGLGEGLTKSTSLTAFTLTIKSEHDFLDGDWGKDLHEALARSTLLTAFTLTINCGFVYLNGDWGKDLGEGVAKSTSLTAFTLIINGKRVFLTENWAKDLGEGVAKSTSLTAFTLTINSGYGYLSGDWGKGLGKGLAKSTSLTAFTLTINREYGSFAREWEKGLGEGLAKSMSLTAFTLTINGEHRIRNVHWGLGLGKGLARRDERKRKKCIKMRVIDGETLSKFTHSSHLYRIRPINHGERTLDSGSQNFSKYSTKLTERKIKRDIVPLCTRNERMQKKCTKKCGDEIFVGKDENIPEVLL